MFTHPLTWKQLINTNVCPRHHVGLVMQEYGNPDTAMVCPKCEDEIVMRKRTVHLGYSRVGDFHYVLFGNQFRDFAEMRANTVKFDSYKEALTYLIDVLREQWGKA